MAVNVTSRKPNMKKRIRSHARNTTNSTQKLNLQPIKLDDGSRVRVSVQEKRTMLKNKKAA